MSTAIMSDGGGQAAPDVNRSSEIKILYLELGVRDVLWKKADTEWGF